MIKWDLFNVENIWDSIENNSFCASVDVRFFLLFMYQIRSMLCCSVILYSEISTVLICIGKNVCCFSMIVVLEVFLDLVVFSLVYLCSRHSSMKSTNHNISNSFLFFFFKEKTSFVHRKKNPKRRRTFFFSFSCFHFCFEIIYIKKKSCSLNRIGTR